MLKQKIPFAVRHIFTTATVITGDNLSRQDAAVDEIRSIYKETSVLDKSLRYLVMLRYRVAKMLTGCYYCPSVDYGLYSYGSVGQRNIYHKNWPSPVWTDAWRFKQKFCKI